MKRFAGTVLLVFVVAVGAFALADNPPQSKAPVQPGTEEKCNGAIR